MSHIMDDPFSNLIISYDRAADDRDQSEVFSWKKDLRRKFLNFLKHEKKSTLIDLGAGTGVHGKYFQDHGINVTCLDMSPALIKKCTEKELKTYQLNVMDLSSIEEVFDSAFALNSLLHIPKDHLPAALSNICSILSEEGLFYWGQYGWGQHGAEYNEGIYQDDTYEPKRFFSLLDDKQIQEFASTFFTIDDFEKIELENSSPLHFQSLILRTKLE